jgi:hypothetical protein
MQRSPTTDIGVFGLDGVHPNRFGYAFMAQFFAAVTHAVVKRVPGVAPAEERAISARSAMSGPKLLGPGTNIGAKIEAQMAQRGWNREAIDKLIQKPTSTGSVRDTRHLPGGSQMDDPATAYVDRQGHYVIRNERIGDIVQVSDRFDLDWGPPW